MIRRALTVLAAVVGLAACGGDDGGDGPPPDAPPPALSASAGVDLYAVVGEPVVLDGSLSTGGTSFLWDFGDGQRWETPRTDPRAVVVYATPGRYQAVITAIDDAGNRRTDAAVVAATWPPSWVPRQAATVIRFPSIAFIGFAALSTDSDELVVLFDGDEIWRAPTCDDPRSVTVWGEWFVVVCDRGDAIELISLAGPTGTRVSAPLPPGSRAHAAVALNDQLWVTLGATGELARFVPGATADSPPVLAGRWRALPDARGLAAWPDGRLAVTRWRSPDDGAVIAFVDPAGLPDAAPQLLRLAVDPQAGSDTEIGGVPSYLDQILVSPNGREAAVPSLQANILEGTFRSARPLTFETTLRAVVSWIDISTGDALDAEDLDRRKQFDDRGLAAAGVFTSRGDYLYVVMPGNRAVERIDVLGGGGQSGSLLEVGFAPDGVALSADDRILAVRAALSREVVLYDVRSFDSLPQPIARVALVFSEPLPAAELRGKQLFHDATDERLAKDGYIACAHCHLDGLSDNRTWDFTDRGEGLRNTIALGGRLGTGDGPVHWSANFDEIQDFEHDLRGPFGGRGLIADADYHSGTRDTPMGDPKAGLSPDLDALAAYVTSIAEPRSPFRNPDGSLPAAAARGRTRFGSLGCASCHAGPRFTDSALLGPGQPLLHDVGTLGPGSGQRLGGPLTGLDTPTLHGLWHSAPYLHDGSATTVRDVLTTRNPAGAHGPTSALTSAELDDLVAYLLCLDGTVD